MDALSLEAAIQTVKSLSAVGWLDLIDVKR